MPDPGPDKLSREAAAFPAPVPAPTLTTAPGEADLAAARKSDSTLADRSPRRISAWAVSGWVLYDLANTIFSMGIISLYFPLWVKESVGEKWTDTVFNGIVAVSMGIIFVASPLLGAITDRARRRMPFLVVSTIICVGLTILLGRFSLPVTALCFILANVAYQAGLQFYDALLPEVSTEENRGRIGGIGVGIGYLGSYLAVGIGLLFSTASKPTLFLIIGISFLLFAVPCFLLVRERGNPNPRPINWPMIANSTQETIRTLKSTKQYPGLLRFLIGRVFYTDAINTVINMMALYTMNVAVANGFTLQDGEKRAKLILLFAITFAVLGGFTWGWLTDKFGPKRTLNLVLQGWALIFSFAAAIGIFVMPLWTMYLLGALAGFCLGGVWAADRPFMLRLTPPARIGEFYGLYGMVGRFSAITGPLIWALASALTVSVFKAPALLGQGIALLTLLVMICVSYVILKPVSDARRTWPESESEK